MSWILGKLVSTNDYLNTIIGQGMEYSSILSDLANRLIGKGLYYRNVHHKDMALIKNPMKRRYSDYENRTFNKIGERTNIKKDDGRQIVFLDDVGGLYGFTHEGGYERLQSENIKVHSTLSMAINKIPSNDIINKSLIDDVKIEPSELIRYRERIRPGIYDYKNTDSYNTLTYKEGSYTYTRYNEGNLYESEKGELSTINNSSVSINTITDENVKDSLINYTGYHYQDGKIKTIINRFYSKIDTTTSLTQSAVNEEYGLSRGRNLLNSGDPKNICGYENPYCRVWTSLHQYAKFKDVIRPFNKDGVATPISILQSEYGALRPNDGANRLNNNTVLNSVGTVRIAPSKKDDIKKCMFSIENLAWKDYKGLSGEQKGPNKGRIMWFPPYGLKFTENVQPQWEGHTFIGRGEKIYTYTNTERSGTLNFILLVDHPSVINSWRRGLGYGEVDNKYEKEQEILRFFAGCGDLKVNDKISVTAKKYTVDTNRITTTTEDVEPVIYNIVAFFPNHYSGIDNSDYPVTIFSGLYQRYEVGEEGTISGDGNKWPVDSDITVVKDKYEIDTYSYGLNNDGAYKYEEYIKEKLSLGVNNKLYSLSDMFDTDGSLTIGKINELLKDYDLKITAQGCASSHGTTNMNKKLSSRRSMLMARWIKDYLNIEVEQKPTRIIDVGKGDDAENRSALQAKIGRCAILTLKFTPKEKVLIRQNIETITEEYDNLNDIPETIRQSGTYSTKEEIKDITNDLDYYQEYEYFKELSSNDNLLYTKLVDKIKYFNPAFHSITPEGFNARLTFLHQCTRQGPTTSASDNRDSKNYGAGNLAFGRAPYCILRIGDFYNTKIMIDALSINYDTNQWDLNPEGIGVQPMLAEISINFKFVGGSDIEGPIERLQNAVSNNYYANTSIYEDNTNK